MICLVFVLYPWKSYVQNAWRELTETGVGALIALILFAAGLKRVSTGLPALSRRGLRILGACRIQSITNLDLYLLHFRSIPD